MRTVCVTGVAGFIGFHLAQRLLTAGARVVGVDNLTPYYDVSLKQARLDCLYDSDGDFHFQQLDVADVDALTTLHQTFAVDEVVHLAAQAGVRYSLTDPFAYAHSNLNGFLSVLEACRRQPVRHLLYASSSSVYGANTSLPFAVADAVNQPLSLYAATKRADELMAHAYAHLFSVPMTGVRFFTVYGPWGRPDMALFHFTKKILAGEPVDVYNNGDHQRDFTYIDDIVDGTLRLLDAPPAADTSPPCRLYNLGRGKPVTLNAFINAVEAAVGKQAKRRLLPYQPGDMVATWADISDARRDVGYAPSVDVADGVARFVHWYRQYYRL